MVRLLFLVAISLVTLTSITASASPADEGYQTVERPDEEDDLLDGGRGDERDPSLLHRFFPLSVDDGLHPAADDVSTLFFVGSVLPGGSLWLPLLLSDADTPWGFLLWAPMGVVLRLLPHAACAATFPCAVGLAFTPIGAPALLVGIILQLANLGTCVANLGYLTPVWLLNDYSRALSENEPTDPVSAERPDLAGSGSIAQNY